MAKKLKINFQQTQTIREAFDDFLLQKKALGLADKTIETYSHHFDIISKYLDSSAPIAGLYFSLQEYNSIQLHPSDIHIPPPPCAHMGQSAATRC